MPIVDPHVTPGIILRQEAVYNQEQVWNPGDYAPWSGYASKVDTETDLRGQLYALQTCTGAYYVPRSESDMYKVRVETGDERGQPFKELFKKNEYCPFNPNPFPEGSEKLFWNETRAMRLEGDQQQQQASGGTK